MLEITPGAHGTVFVGSGDAGKVYALTDSQGRGVADRVRVIASGLESPVGVAFEHGDLHVSAVSRIVVLRDIEKSFAPLSTDSVGTLAQDHTFAREAREACPLDVRTACR